MEQALWRPSAFVRSAIVVSSNGECVRFHDAARAILGHSSTKTTEVYAELDAAKTRQPTANRRTEAVTVMETWFRLSRICHTKGDE